MLLEIQNSGIEQTELDLDVDAPRRDRPMGAMDSVNDRHGQGAVILASAGLRQSVCV